MPKAYLRKTDPALDPEADDDDHGAAAQRRVLITSAGAASAGKPAGAANSVFDVAKAAKSTADRAAGRKLDMAAVIIHKARPVPPARSGTSVSIYPQIWDSLAVGDCAELPDRNANSLLSFARKVSGSVTVRRLSATTKGVWRNA